MSSVIVCAKEGCCNEGWGEAQRRGCARKRIMPESEQAQAQVLPLKLYISCAHYSNDNSRGNCHSRGGECARAGVIENAAAEFLLMRVGNLLFRSGCCCLFWFGQENVGQLPGVTLRSVAGFCKVCWNFASPLYYVAAGSCSSADRANKLVAEVFGENSCYDRAKAPYALLIEQDKVAHRLRSRVQNMVLG